MSRVSKRVAATLIMVSVAFTTIAQLLFSFVMKKIGAHVPLSKIVSVAFSLPATDMVLLALGVALYAVSMLIWIVALTRFSVSLAYPMLSISYVLVYVAATNLPFFDEAASLQRTLGVALIVVGVSVLFLDERFGNGGKLVPRE